MTFIDLSESRSENKKAPWESPRRLVETQEQFLANRDQACTPDRLRRTP
jgi:hypothetical protein